MTVAPSDLNMGQFSDCFDVPPQFLPIGGADQPEESSICDRLPWRKILGAGVALLSLAGGITLKVYALTDPRWKSANDQLRTTQYDTIANLINGLAATMLADSVLPQKVNTAVFNELKRFCVPLFEIATQVQINVLYAQSVYGHPGPTELVQQLYITPVTMANSALSLHDMITIRNLSADRAAEERVNRNAIPLFLEGDAKSKTRMAAQQGPLLALGIALTVLGYTLQFQNHKDMGDAGIVAGTYALGSAAFVAANELFEKLDSAVKNRKIKAPPPRVLTCLNTIIKTFQLAWPIGVGMAVVPNHPVTYGITGFLYGAGHRLSQMLFQYRLPEATGAANSIWSRIKGIWDTRKKDVMLNAAFYALMAGWTAWGESDPSAGSAEANARIRAAVGALFGTTVASAIGTGLVDLAWKPGDSGIQNSLFYNLVVLPPWALIYLLMQTKIVANDIFLNSASPLGYAAGVGALATLGMAIGADRWTQMRTGRMDPALTPYLGRALLSWTLAKVFTGQIDRAA